MSLVHTAIFFPNITLSITAYTKENAAKTLKEKYDEIMMYYPMLQNEVKSSKFSDDQAEILFTSGGKIDILANAQSSKGFRRRRLNVEESALLNDTLFQDVLHPIVNVPRRTLGKGSVDPQELNGQVHFFTTAAYRGSSEYNRNLAMLKDMAELKGKMVIGSGWELGVHYGRGEKRSQILSKKDTSSPIFFSQNYSSHWTGATDDALVSINKLLDLRTLTKAELKLPDKRTTRSEYVISMDVARSQSSSNNQSSIAVLKTKHARNGKLVRVQLVNLINLPNGLNFTDQTIILKKTRQLYGANHVIVDGNSLGMGIVDECLKDTIDPETGESLGCWATTNTDQEPEERFADAILYVLKSTGINTDIIVNFIDMVESKKLELLEKRADAGYELGDQDYFKENILPFVQTDLLIEEIANLKIKHKSGGKLDIEQVTRSVDKDRYSALAYGLYYVKLFLMDTGDGNDDYDVSKYLLIN